MEFEVWDKSTPDVSYSQAVIKFPAFDFYKKQAEIIAEQISQTEVTEENTKEVKALLADARRVTDRLNRKRIDIKNEIMSGYKDFESQVNELAEIVSTAEDEVREKVRILDEIERDKKREVIEELWGKRAGQYQIFDLLPTAFDMWLTPQMLNKSTSMKAVETDMVEWLEDTEKAIDTLKSMDDEYLVEYLGCLDIATAIQTVKDKQEIKAKISASADEDTEEKATFVIKGKKDIKLTEHLLTENEINYTII